MTSEGPKRKIRLCVIINPSIGLYYAYRGQHTYLLERGFEITAVSSPGPEHELVRKTGVRTHAVPMVRLPDPFKDAVSLIRLLWFLLWHRFDIVVVSTPKASLLGALAASLSGHHLVFYTVRGRAYENMVGWNRRLMCLCERIVCGLATVVHPVSRELGALLVKEGICPPRKLRMIGYGSSNGVDIERFDASEDALRRVSEIRMETGASSQDVLILFVGWLRKEKGVNELVRAFAQLARERSRVRLVMVGQYYPPDALDDDVRKTIEDHPHISVMEWCTEPAPYFLASDMVVLPSYREGFPRVPLEAGAACRPVVATDVIGCREAVLHEQTGLLAPLGDVGALAEAMKRLVDAPGLRGRLGQGGRRRVEREFRQEIIWEGVHKEYKELLARRHRR